MSILAHGFTRPMGISTYINPNPNLRSQRFEKGMPLHLGRQTANTEIATGALKVRSFDVSLTAETPIEFTHLAGDTIWGALGKHLIRYNESLYTNLLKPGGHAGQPSPFVLSSIPGLIDYIEPGQSFTVTISLMGWAATQQTADAIILALSKLRFSGLGTNRNNGNGRVSVTHATSLRNPLNVSRALEANPTEIGIRFITPVYLKKDGHAAPPSAGLLVRRLGWRITEFHRLYGNVKLDFRPLIAIADTLESHFDNNGWLSADRFSRRQTIENNRPTWMPTGGYLGTLSLKGNVQPLLPLLQLGEILHAGKNAERGYGKLEITDLTTTT